MIDKKYCMSSYLALRYVEDKNKQFFDGLTHQVYEQHQLKDKVMVGDAQDESVEHAQKILDLIDQYMTLTDGLSILN